ncbi:hypothetical protein GCM10022223_65390 [Kineosporia mesophila]|uniref:Uncharacterized protein n=1 Tax=Kineosporia mesophila TaxID=566012 RepID=A0ABP7AQQ7_9ACTN
MSPVGPGLVRSPVPGGWQANFDSVRGGVRVNLGQALLDSVPTQANSGPALPNSDSGADSDFGANSDWFGADSDWFGADSGLIRADSGRIQLARG